MIRLVAAFAASLLLAPSALAQAKPDAEKADKPEKAAPGPAPALDLDARTQEAIKRAVEKAKDEIRDEVRAELQGAQSAAEFLGATSEGPKLEFFELDGYLRTRGQLYDQLGLGAGVDPQGEPTFFPEPLFSPGKRSTLATSNMRFRLEPTLNVSDNVRVKAQVDVFDNYVLGSSTSTAFDSTFGSYPTPFYGSSRTVYQFDPHQDRPAVNPKRAWADVQTPAGLLSFGRMPSGWGLGVLTNAGSGLDQDFGDTVDRMQFALPPVVTPIGPLTFIPMIDFDAEGALNKDPHWGSGVGQPFDVDSADDARTYALKAVRIDTDDELRRKLDRGESSLNFGAYYAYRTQRNVFPDWLVNGYDATLAPGSEPFAKRRAYGHVIDGWARFVLPRWRFEVEGVGVLGHIGNAFVVGQDTAGEYVVKSLGNVKLRQWGAVFQGEFKAIPNKVSLGLEIGAASGDDAPGFGVNTSRGLSLSDTSTEEEPDYDFQRYGSADGPQFGDFTRIDGNGQHRDRDVRNFRFNPAYRVDQILFRTILGQVTDALYVKPSLKWDLFPGLQLDIAVVYSQAMQSTSTPSAEEDGDEATYETSATVVDKGNTPLGLELDTLLTYTSADGFSTWFSYGVLQPLPGLGNQLTRGHAMQLGFAARF